MRDSMRGAWLAVPLIPVLCQRQRTDPLGLRAVVLQSRPDLLQNLLILGKVPGL
jgi:hypothetical protein